MVAAVRPGDGGTDGMSGAVAGCLVAGIVETSPGCGAGLAKADAPIPAPDGRSAGPEPGAGAVTRAIVRSARDRTASDARARAASPAAGVGAGSRAIVLLRSKGAVVSVNTRVARSASWRARRTVASVSWLAAVAPWEGASVRRTAGRAGTDDVDGSIAAAAPRPSALVPSPVKPSPVKPSPDMMRPAVGGTLGVVPPVPGAGDVFEPVAAAVAMVRVGVCPVVGVIPSARSGERSGPGATGPGATGGNGSGAVCRAGCLSAPSGTAGTGRSEID